MPLQYNQYNNPIYVWSHGTQRPGKPQHFSQQLLAGFLESRYALETTLADFIRAHPNALNNGVINQLHRRHVISWDLIKRFTAKAAATNFNRDLANLTQNIFQFFHVNPTTAASLQHGPQRASAWEQIAKQMCWVDSNVFVGPSAGNVGVDIDQGNELTDNERRDLLAGAAWRGAAMVHAQMEGLVNG